MAATASDYRLPAGAQMVSFCSSFAEPKLYILVQILLLLVSLPRNSIVLSQILEAIICAAWTPFLLEAAATIIWMIWLFSTHWAVFCEEVMCVFAYFGFLYAIHSERFSIGSWRCQQLSRLLAWLKIARLLLSLEVKPATCRQMSQTVEEGEKNAQISTWTFL